VVVAVTQLIPRRAAPGSAAPTPVRYYTPL
jgi:hypothetical protein